MYAYIYKYIYTLYVCVWASVCASVWVVRESCALCSRVVHVVTVDLLYDICSLYLHLHLKFFTIRLSLCLKSPTIQKAPGFPHPIHALLNKFALLSK